ncbi:MAG: hypothetical protein AAFY00_09485 [Bacteroidota bacterium]
MNRLVILYGCVLLSSSAIAEVQQDAWDIASAEVILESEGKLETFSNEVSNTSETFFFDINEIEYIEDEDIELGFDTKDYLPEDFDPYTAYLDLNSIEFVEQGDETFLGFDSTKFLPLGFDPYTEAIGVQAVNFMTDEDVELGFDTAKYLPEGFSPFEVYFDLNSIIYIDIEKMDGQEVILPWESKLKNEPYN